MRPDHALEALLVRALAAGVGACSWRVSLALGSRLGRCAHALGLRRAVATDNLGRAFPERPAAEQERILTDHYRELGRVACEYPRLSELVHAPLGRVFAAVYGLEHLERARGAGRGAILLTGHFGNFELGGAYLGTVHPVSFVVKPLSNPAVDSLVQRWRSAAGVERIPLGTAVRGVYRALRQNRWVAMLADQDARRRGVFVPFLGRPCSTPRGPAELSLRTGAPIVMGFVVRGADGRHTLHVTAPVPPPERDDPDPVRTLTARHTEVLEAWVRRHPEMWFWLHRRWKTVPPEPAVAHPATAAAGGR